MSIELIGVTPASSLSFNITADLRVADPFTPANLTLNEISAGITNNWAGFYVHVATQDATDTGILNICTGAAASEVSIAVLPVRLASRNNIGWSIYVPIPVSSGTRLTVGASTATGGGINVQIVGMPTSNFSASPTYTKLESGPYNLENVLGSYGRGVEVTPDAVTAHTKGAYVEISQAGTNGGNNVLNGDSLPQQYDYLGLAFADTVNSAQTAQDRLWDVAYGAAASETIFLPDYYQRVTGGESTSPPSPLWIPWGRTAGDRISARMQCSILDAADFVGSVMLFGLR